MKLETYEERMQELGISRGSLAAGFMAESEERVTVHHQHKSMINEGVSERVKPPPVTEDLSHLASTDKFRPKLSVDSLLKRVKPERREIYRSLYQRGESPDALAGKAGITSWLVQLAFAGRATRNTKDRLWDLLTPRERKILGWRR